MSISANRVELAGRVEDVRGGRTRDDGYWLLIRMTLDDDDERPTRLSVWWFGGKDDRDIYQDVVKGARVEVVGELRWGKDRNDEWELRVVALSLGVVTKRNGRNGREERDDSEARKGRDERNGKREVTKRRVRDEEVPF